MVQHCHAPPPPTPPHKGEGSLQNPPLAPERARKTTLVDCIRLNYNQLRDGMP